MDFLTELNEQAETLVKELREARKSSAEAWGATKAYHKGRAEELEKWLHSVEGMISRIIERREG